jgi:outer membrane lipoprotein-sorting protein
MTTKYVLITAAITSLFLAGCQFQSLTAPTPTPNTLETDSAIEAEIKGLSTEFEMIDPAKDFTDVSATDLQ